MLRSLCRDVASVESAYKNADNHDKSLCRENYVTDIQNVNKIK